MVVVYKPIILKHRVNKEADKKQGVGFFVGVSEKVKI